MLFAACFAVANLEEYARLPSRAITAGARILDVDSVNTKAAKMTIVGWFAGMAYYNWFSSTAVHLAWWQHALLIIVGMFAASIVIGAGMALLAGLLTKVITGRSDGNINAFAWAAFISPVLAFFAAKYVLQFLGA
ncbi:MULTISPECIES: hypothetical protein [Rhizobium/Agrobacterium group]|uniref:hypothetical protein n=1 Tax=Rhizobium/Agrobacterium group TaxID=227290 RepID=UPI001177F4DF|nr:MULTISPECIES: hypothetical protein [Rhizobium/Agrobacterium group]MCF1484600.1 hypothetical protein [Allorhizobium ampelinum]NSZ41766.1 hypothetical protein [Agrobacterium vitis]NTA25475.1 hypothetical protein [Allorhizobium ampelinum]